MDRNENAQRNNAKSLFSGTSTNCLTVSIHGVRPAVGAAFTWPIDKLVGHCLASLQLVGHLFRVLRERGGILGVGAVSCLVCALRIGGCS